MSDTTTAITLLKSWAPCDVCGSHLGRMAVLAPLMEFTICPGCADGIAVALDALIHQAADQPQIDGTQG